MTAPTRELLTVPITDGPAATTSLGHLPGERWLFDQAVVDVFPDMLRRSIPDYDQMRRMVFDLGSLFVQPDTQILDLGCARGDAMVPFVTTFGAANRHVGVDVSAPMVEAARSRLARQIAEGYVEILNLDLRHCYPTARASLTLCVLTLQFTPLEHRQRILRSAFTSTVPGGAVVLVEKVLGSTDEINRMMVNLYHAFKAGNGYTQEEIERKRAALEGVLMPLTAGWNERLLRDAGFEQVDCFWRWMNFAGWIAIKP